MRTLAIVNPVAGGGRGYRAWRQIRPQLEAAGLRVEDAVARRPMEAWAQAERAARDRFDLVISVGGDGTIHETVNGLLAVAPAAPPALGIIPGGTANILARGLGLPRNPHEAGRLLLRGTRRRIDVGRVNGRYFLSIAGAGFDGEVAAAVNRWRGDAPYGAWRWRLPAKPLYVASILLHLATFRPFRARIIIDGAARETPVYFVAAANTPWYGGPMHIAPNARPDSGTLAVVYATDLSPLDAVQVLLSTFSGRHLRHAKVVHSTALEVRVDTDVPVAVQADGETIGRAPVTFRVIPAALEIVT